VELADAAELADVSVFLTAARSEELADVSVFLTAARSEEPRDVSASPRVVRSGAQVAASVVRLNAIFSTVYSPPFTR